MKGPDLNNVHSEAKSSLFSLSYSSLLFCIGASIVLLAYYFYLIMPTVFVPADIILWAETSFVGDIIKLRIGSPLYTNPADSNSMIYTPGAQLLTYGISLIIGKPTSIVTWRLIQLAYVFCASILASSCVFRLCKLSSDNYRIRFARTWLVFSFVVLFLAATAPRVNPYTCCLHADALSLLVSVFSFWTILYYLDSPNWKRIILMAVCPAIGYLVKQYLVSWLAIMGIILLLHNPKKIKRLIIFFTIATALVGVAIGVCYGLWGDNFIFWTFKIMGGDRRKLVLSPAGFHISVIRSFEHLFRIWMEFLIGVVGGFIVLNKSNFKRLGPVWIGWIILIFSEALTSGGGWHILYHFGPGVVIGTIWLLAGLQRVWFNKEYLSMSNYSLLNCIAHNFIIIIGVITIFIALHVMPTNDFSEDRYYKRRLSPDVNRYISDIEREFEGYSINRVLLDVGNWIYLKHSFLAKDRGVQLCDQGQSGIYENLEIFVDRIRSKVYEKILVRDFDSPFFIYEWDIWDRPSGVRKALLENYKLVKTIPPVDRYFRAKPIIFYSGPVSVFVPK